MMLNPVIFQLVASSRVAEKAAHMAEIDPHGATLTVVSVSVVFGALIILFIAYSISGKLFTREKAAPVPSATVSSTDTDANEEEIAAAIAVALYEEEMAAAASMSEGIHDFESGIITIKR